MKINVISVLNNDGASLSYEGVSELGEFEFTGSRYNFEKPLSVIGKVQNTGGSLEFTAHIEGEFFTNCARCNKEIKRTVSYDVVESVSQSGKGNDAECVSIKGNIADISGLIVSELFNSMEMRYLCSENCRGLCINCGADLNEVECDCEKNN